MMYVYIYDIHIYIYMIYIYVLYTLYAMVQTRMIYPSWPCSSNHRDFVATRCGLRMMGRL